MPCYPTVSGTASTEGEQLKGGKSVHLFINNTPEFSRMTGKCAVVALVIACQDNKQSLTTQDLERNVFP